ncbi:hypothetical protein F511_10485 [Dorcoceras hygrometricum]|uniref:TMEM205-like domain-containing protein n=1 Tax=Dorcoceras hygrometricum TaxID=472368 RepID=A0A2Z7D1M9_9LAMI|nr:hypothetical protein F511_10485 [Dorcoceras hygrometricum]
MCVWVTFAWSYVLGTALPRHQFGFVQSKMYPVYFKAMAYSVGVAFLGQCLMSGHTKDNAAGIGIFQASNLIMSIVLILVNLLFLQPLATKVMLKEDGKGEITTGERTAAKSEICRAFLNFMILVSLTCHILHLARRLHNSC